MATLDELTVKIKADSSQFTREMNKLGTTTQQASSKMGTALGVVRTQLLALVPLLAGAAVIGFARNAIAAADALNDLSSRTGVAASYLSSMRTEIENSGGTIEQFAQALFMMNRQIGEGIKDSTGPAAQALQELGLQVSDLVNNSPEQNFRIIAEAISLLPTQFERAEASAALFGRGVAGLTPIIERGADGIDEITSKAGEFGSSLSEEQLKAIDDFGDAMNSLGNTMENLASGAFANVVIAVQSIIGVVGEGIDQIRLLSAGGLDALSYMEKAKAGGFATTIERGEVISKKPYGPNQKTAQASSDRKAATKEIKDMAKATDELDVVMEKVGDQSVVSARIIKDSFADALEASMFDFKNFGNAASSILSGLAKNLARKAIIDPLSTSLDGLFFGSGSSMARPSSDFIGPMPQDTGIFRGMFSGLGFADGGRPPLGKYSIVGENGPELFKPDTAGTVIPNGFGGDMVVNVINNSNASVSTRKTRTANGTSLEIQIDELVAANIANAGSRTNQALRTVQNQSLIRR